MGRPAGLWCEALGRPPFCPEQGLGAALIPAGLERGREDTAFGWSRLALPWLRVLGPKKVRAVSAQLKRLAPS